MKKLFPIISIVSLLVLIVAIFFFKSKLQRKGGEEKKLSVNLPKNILSMNIQSSAFNNNSNIPIKYTCSGENVNPPLIFSDIPKQAKSLVLIVDDPDAPAGVWNHWLVWNISPTISEIKENSVPAGSIQGKNDFGNNKYDGPCPPPGRPHRYRFKAFALNSQLDLSENSTQKIVEEKMKGYVLAQTELRGLFGR